MDTTLPLATTILGFTGSSFLLLAARRPQRRMRRRRHYLTRLAIPLSCQSAWRSVLRSIDDKAFLNTLMFDVSTFYHLHQLFAPAWDLRYSSRRGVGGRRSMKAMDVLGLVLKYVTSCCSDKELCQIFAHPPAIICRYLHQGIDVLLSVVRNDHACRVCWPSAAEMQYYAALIHQRNSDIDNVYGFVDGVYFPMHDPPHPDTQNAYYNEWKAMCSITNVIVFAADGSIIWAHYNLPGSWHDSRVASQLYKVLADERLTPAPYALISDPAFPRPNQMRNKIIAPKPVEAAYSSNLRLGRADAQLDGYNQQVVTARQAVEWGMHSLQSVFRRLSVKLDYNPSANAVLLKLIIHLFNLRIRMVGLNQSCSVYCGPIPPPLSIVQ